MREEELQINERKSQTDHKPYDVWCNLCNLLYKTYTVFRRFLCFLLKDSKRCINLFCWRELLNIDVMLPHKSREHKMVWKSFTRTSPWILLSLSLFFPCLFLAVSENYDMNVSVYILCLSAGRPERGWTPKDRMCQPHSSHQNLFQGNMIIWKLRTNFLIWRMMIHIILGYFVLTAFLLNYY